MPPPLIAGLYPYTRAGHRSRPHVTLREIPLSLETNSEYRDQLVLLAGDRDSAHALEGFGLRVHKIFDDAPKAIHHDSAHLMKHWMCRWALREFGEFLWLDWDTVLLRPFDSAFWEWARSAGTPKFLHIPGYWALVNCGVYYAPANWLNALEESFTAVVSEPNDELLWRSVLPEDLPARKEFWWGERVVNVWTRDELARITRNTYVAHIHQLGWAYQARNASLAAV